MMYVYSNEKFETTNGDIRKNSFRQPEFINRLSLEYSLSSKRIPTLYLFLWHYR